MIENVARVSYAQVFSVGIFLKRFERIIMALIGDLPEQFGRYRIIKRLGQGGMGSVYLAEDSQLGRKVALKVAHVAAAEDPELTARFRREARAAAALRHENLCRIHDAGEIDGTQFLTMEFIEGESLAARLRSLRTLPECEAAQIVSKLAKALGVAHEAQVIHRDLKPSNVMMELTKNGLQPIIVDFGLAWHNNDPTEQKLTRTGEIFGTPHYMAPEQVEGDSGGMCPLCDIYALGVIFYELLTGRTPFDGKTPWAVVAQILKKENPNPSTIRPDLDPRFEAICIKAMAKDKENRFRSMEEFFEALDDVLETPSWAEPFQTLGVSDLAKPGRDKDSKVLDQRATDIPKSANSKVDEPIPKKCSSPTTGMELMLVPAGEFDMGSGVNDRVAYPDEKPRRHVRITRRFYFGKFAVTRGQFGKFVEDTGYKTGAESDGKGGCGWNPKTKTFEQDAKYTWRSPGFEQTDDHPVVNVSWNDAVKFAKWLSKKDGQPYRLPTEAEWEYACRAGSTTRFSFGDDLNQLPQYANIAGERDGFQYTSPAGKFRPNAFGLYDMHGNVWEWCSDWYDDGISNHSSLDDPQGPEMASLRVLRGGGWSSVPRSCRSANRNCERPEHRSGNVGFRLVAD